MIRSILLASLCLVWFACAPALAQDGALTLDEVVALKDLGYSDDDVLKEVERTGTTLVLSPADRARLEAAGAGPKLLEAFGAAAPLDAVEQAVAWHRDGKASRWILEQLLEAEPVPRAPAELLPAVRAGLTRRVLVALRGRPLRIADVAQLPGDGASVDEMALLVEWLGLEFEMDARAAEELGQQGVPEAWIVRLGERPEGAGPDGSAGWPPTPALPAEVDRHRNIAGLYSIDVPRGWRVVKSSQLGFSRTLFTPFEGVRATHEPPVALSVNYEFFERGQSLLLLPIEDLGPRMVEFVRHDYPSLAEDQAARSVEASPDRNAFWTALSGPLVEAGEPVVATLGIVRSGKLLYTLMAWCRATDEPTHATSLRKLLHGFVPLAPETRQTPREAVPLESYAVTGRLKGSVVMIRALTGGSGATGTGFFVREDGYILTNHHVVWNDAANAAHEDITVHWDESLDLAPRPARVVAAFRGEDRAYDRAGIDVALLKIEGRGYAPIPLSPVSSIELADPIVTLGFPMTSIFTDVSIFVTKGVVTRINRLADGTVNSLFIDAKITHGNSGGPTIDLMTGGAIGINSYVAAEGQENTLDLYGYNGVIPIDRAVDQFPQILSYPPGALDSIGPAEHVELGFAFLARKRTAAARSEFEAALAGGPSADAWIGLAECRWADGEADAGWEAIAAAEAALRDDEEEHDVLEYLESTHLSAGNAERAIELAERVLAHKPDRWAAYADRGRAHGMLGKKAEAYADLERARAYLLDLLPDAHVISAEVALELGDVETARALLDEASAKFPDSLEVHLGLAACSEKEGEVGAAAEGLLARKARFGRAPLFFDRLAGLLAAAGRTDEALEAYAEARRLHEEIEGRFPVDVAEAAARVQMSAGRLDLAFLSFLAAIRQDSSSARAASLFSGLAEVHARDGATGGIPWAHLARALELDPEESNAKRLVESIPRADFPIEAVRILSGKLGYPPSIVADLVLASGATYDVTDGKAVELAGLGLDLAIVEALRKASPADGPEGAAPGAPAESGADPGVEVGDFEPAFTEDRSAIAATLTFTNRNPFPVRRVEFRVVSFDAEGAEVATDTFVLKEEYTIEPGEAEALAVTLVEAAGAGAEAFARIARVNVTVLSCERVLPADEGLVEIVSIEPYVKGDQEGIAGTLTVRNASAFAVADLRIRARGLTAENEEVLVEELDVPGVRLAAGETRAVELDLFLVARHERSEVQRVNTVLVTLLDWKKAE